MSCNMLECNDVGKSDGVVIEGDGEVGEGVRGMVYGKAATELKRWDPACRGAQHHTRQGRNCPLRGHCLSWGAADSCRTSSIS